MEQLGRTIPLSICKVLCKGVHIPFKGYEHDMERILIGLYEPITKNEFIDPITACSGRVPISVRPADWRDSTTSACARWTGSVSLPSRLLSSGN